MNTTTVRRLPPIVFGGISPALAVPVLVSARGRAHGTRPGRGDATPRPDALTIQHSSRIIQVVNRTGGENAKAQEPLSPSPEALPQEAKQTPALRGLWRSPGTHYSASRPVPGQSPTGYHVRNLAQEPNAPREGPPGARVCGPTVREICGFGSQPGLSGRGSRRLTEGWQKPRGAAKDLVCASSRRIPAQLRASAKLRLVDKPLRHHLSLDLQ